MHIDKDNAELCWISWILRLAMGVLFALAAVGKFMGGIGNTAAMITGMFKDTFLPVWLVTPYAHGIAFAEALAAIWLLSGIKLRAGWIFTALIFISLGFGLLVAKQSAADIYMYILICCAGLYASKYDKCALGRCCQK